MPSVALPAGVHLVVYHSFPSPAVIPPQAALCSVLQLQLGSYGVSDTQMETR